MSANKNRQRNFPSVYYSCIVLFRTGSVKKSLLIVCLIGLLGRVSFAQLPIPDSEINYPGASTSMPFVAMEPYVLNIQGVNTTYSLGGFPRTYDFSGTVPFVNPATGKNDPFCFQAYHKTLGDANGLVDWYEHEIRNTGVLGRIGKTTFGNDPVTMVKYNAGDGITYEKCRSKICGWPIPPRTRVRWELEVAFGKADGVNDWTLTPSWDSPVLFFQIKSNKNQTHPPLGLNIDTDSKDPSKLMITVFQRVGTATSPSEIARAHGISPGVMTSIVIEGFLDERPASGGGKGILKIWVDGNLVLEKAGPTLSLGSGSHEWSIETYLWNEPSPYQYNRATFYKTARMLVFPSTPTGLVETIDRNFLKVYPNPAHTCFALKVSPQTVLYNAVIKIYDSGGKEVKTVLISNNETSIDRDELQNGIYFYNIINNNQSIAKGKLICQ